MAKKKDHTDWGVKPFCRAMRGTVYRVVHKLDEKIKIKFTNWDDVEEVSPSGYHYIEYSVCYNNKEWYKTVMLVARHEVFGDEGFESSRVMPNALSIIEGIIDNYMDSEIMEDRMMLHVAKYLQGTVNNRGVCE